MKNNLQTLMLEVSALTQAGRLREATAAIRRALGAAHASSAYVQAAQRADPRTLDIEARVLRDDEVHADAMSNVEAPAPKRDAQPAPMPARDGGAQFLAGSYSNGAGTRQYKLYVPAGQHDAALPLVVMLHGCKQNPDDFAAGTRMNELAERTPCFVLYPAQAKSANGSGCWNWFNGSDQQREHGEPSIIAGMTRRIIATYPIDAGRVYIAGLSAGGAMAATMAATHPDLYAAVGVHSGLAHAAAHDVASAFAAMRQGPATTRMPPAGASVLAVPTIVFHGDRDATVHPRNAARVIAQAHGGAVPSTAEAQASAGLSASAERGQVRGGHAYTRTIYRDANGEGRLEDWLVHDAGHAWAGGSTRGSFTDPKGPDASAQMLRFFLEHRRR
jgi:poly(hydroxyalkanoate) depolymerase family esterase